MNESMQDEKRRLMELMLKKKHQSGSAGENQSNKKQRIPRRDLSKPAGLSFAQQRLWFLDELTPGNAAYAFCNIVRLNGKLDVGCLEKCFGEIVNRHENLRTTFQIIDGAPVQIIADSVETRLSMQDISEAKDSEKENKLQALATLEAEKPFSLSSGPLIRASIVRIAEEKHAVILTMHHIVYDGWSLAVLFGELKTLYEAFIKNKPSPLPALNIQYADFSLWQRREIETEKMQKQAEFWRNKLSDQLPILDLPTDRKRLVTSEYKGAMEWFYLPVSLTRLLEVLAKREDCTLYMVLLAAFSVLLSRYSGEKDIIVGTPIANRNNQEVENLIGFFINSLVMRTSLEDNPDFCQLLERIKIFSAEAYANQDYPFEKMVEDLQIERNMGQNPIFQTMFALQNTPPPPKKIADIEMQIEEVDSGTAVFDITLSMYETDEGLNGYFEYSSELYNQSTIQNMINSFECLLNDISHNPEKEVSRLSILNKETYKKIVTDWNSEKLEFSTDRLIFEVIDDIADSRPDAVVITTGTTLTEQQYTWQQLNQQACKLANILLGKGVRPGDFIGICLNRSFEMFVSILGVMKAGGAYLPMDPAYPRDRLQYMLEDTAANIIITQRELSECLPDSSAEKYYIEDIEAFSKNTTVKTPEVMLTPDSIAYIIYTSGSTGKPKGVLVSHGNLLHSTAVRREYYKERVESFLLMSSFSFDSSVAGIFWTLCDGGTLVLPAYGQERDIFEVAKLINEHSVSHMLSLPSVYSLLLTSAPARAISALKTVCVAGEECPSSLLEKHFDTLPDTRLFNEYGPTEGTVWSTVYECIPEDAGKVIPIGGAIKNVQIYILDENLSVQPIGVPGEIYIAGKGVTRGYLNRDELTAEKFIENPFSDNSQKMYRSGDIGKYRADGNIEFLGRVDDQVKVRGYRIEPGEIENAILQNPAITQCAVIVQKTERGDNRLIAYIEPPQTDTEKLIAALSLRLPAYMVPALFIRLETMPLMPNGKINRKALPEPASAADGLGQKFVESKNAVEQVLANIWADLLEIDRVSTAANFFELGGHSILATRVVSGIYENFDVQVAIRHLFDSPTVSALSAILLSDKEDAKRIMETAELIVQIDGLSEEEVDALMDEEIG